ncbi:hypothetical protein K7G98_34300, partial [Saccharothrix sp. MB29]|nr:hypothetical protein [Saccharothrix sp. MB29]
MTAASAPSTPPETTPDAAVAAQDTATEPTLLAAQCDEKARMLWQEGLPADAVLLAPSMAATPMRQPGNTWAMLVLAADVLDDTVLPGLSSSACHSFSSVSVRGFTRSGTARNVGLVLVLVLVDMTTSQEVMCRGRHAPAGAVRPPVRIRWFGPHD